MRRQNRFPAAVLCAVLAAVASSCRPSSPKRSLVVYSVAQRARSDSAAELTQASSMDVDAQGNIYVADLSAIRVFGPDGRLLRSIGREGTGPGEFGQLRSVSLTAGDSVAAFDYGIGRMTVFAPGSSRAAYTSLIGQNQLFPPYEARRVAQGRYIIAMFQAAYGSFDDRERTGPKQVVVRLLNADGSVRRDSVMTVGERENLILHNPEAVAIHPFGRMTHFGFASGDRIVAEWSDSLKFDVYSVEGQHLKTIRPSHAPPRRPITVQERDSAAAALANDLVPAAPIVRAMEKHGATTWPLAQGLVVDDQDRIWVGITGLRGEPNHWTAFDMDGERVAQLDLPGNMQLRLVRGSTAYVAATDINDVPQVVVLDLKPTQTLALNRR